MKRFLVLLLAVLGLCSSMVACGGQQTAEEGTYQIYVLNNEETKVESHACDIMATGKADMLEEFIDALSAQSERLEYKAPFSLGFHLLSANIVDNQIILDMDEAYGKLSASTEVLARAAIVRTLTQIPGVRYVQFTVDGRQLYDNTGNAVGPMSADLFIDNDGNEINTYELARVKLYFANSTEDKIIGAYREKYYSTNMPMERFIVEELILGPSGKVEGLYPTINPETKILGVTTQDGVCYVNFDSGFLTSVNNVQAETAIYSIVNSLTELNNVTKVQILVGGEVPAGYEKSVYERNLEYVSSLKAETKTDDKTETKTETKTDNKTEPQTDAKTETETKTDTRN
ncbi:MAG: GerMN domain-containing protein [Lachnospiraceae bacterium]|nr:GerMN domain-containing protein [Lachnospiraceae bacterium]